MILQKHSFRTLVGLFASVVVLLFSCTTVSDGQELDSDRGPESREQEASTAEESSGSGMLPAVPEGHIRVHYQRIDGMYDDMVLWLWNDTTWQSESGWPNGLEASGTSDYGLYYDVPMAEDYERLGIVVVNQLLGDPGKDGGDKIITFTNPAINQIWLVQGSDEVLFAPPVDLPENTIRVHYFRPDGQYENMVLWLWEDVAWESETGWPNGLEKSGIGAFGAYYDVPMNENPSTLGFLAVDKTMGDSGKDGGDKKFSLLDQYNQVFIRSGDDEVYVTPFYTSPTGLLAAQIVAIDSVELQFTTTDGLTEDDLLSMVTIVSDDGVNLDILGVEFMADGKTVRATVESIDDGQALNVSFDGRDLKATKGWRFIDSQYAYDGWLGPRLNEDGSATIKMWSPTAQSVAVQLFDKDDSTVAVGQAIPMVRGDKAVWQLELDSSNSGLNDLRGYFYHLLVDNGDGPKAALDPYAPSLAEYNSSRDRTAKAAIVDLGSIGPQLSYARIDGYNETVDAIIWEAHVRDLTSDPSIEAQLNAQFGTFEAAIDRLDYAQELGVTHVQLLPVMSFRNGDESRNNERELEYNANGANYNWGYDPQSYFALSGMYSADPSDPEARVEEFKNLVQAIHDRGMGVILDVVYNHTGALEILEDLAPGYYHFMDADGTPRSSYGGGRVGTTHAMSRKLVIDSILHWMEEYKVDGFRFDLMGDMDAETVQMIWDRAVELNPNVIMVGEGWRTYVGDANDPRQAADQGWMNQTDSVAVFSDEIRNELKSGFGSEGQPRFVTGGARDLRVIFNNVKAQPGNFVADRPGDVVTYVAAHDNLTLHDVIAQSAHLDPDVPSSAEEIHRRIRLANGIVLTSQGVPFLHAGQEYGRTKQWRAPGEAEYKATFMTDENGEPFVYPYFIHDSYDSSDAINMINWEQATNGAEYPLHNQTREFTQGLIALRRSSDSFRIATAAEVNRRVVRVDAPELSSSDKALLWTVEGSDGRKFLIAVNADDQERSFTTGLGLEGRSILVDGEVAGTSPISNPQGVDVNGDRLTLSALTMAVIALD